MNISAVGSLSSNAVAALLAARPAVHAQAAATANVVLKASDDQAKSEAAISSGQLDTYL